MERDSDRQKQMEGHCSTGQGSQPAVVPVEEEEDCQHMGTLLDSTPEVPDDSESEMFPCLVIIIQMRRPDKSFVTNDSFPHTFIA